MQELAARERILLIREKTNKEESQRLMELRTGLQTSAVGDQFIKMEEQFLKKADEDQTKNLALEEENVKLKKLNAEQELQIKKLALSHPVIYAVVKCDYVPRPDNDDHLTLGAGNLVAVLERGNPDWWKGQVKGKVGLFPSAVVSFVNSFMPAISLYDYNPGPERADHLVLEKGCRLHVTDRTNTEFWHGVRNGQLGIFPASLVEFEVPCPTPVH